MNSVPVLHPAETVSEWVVS